VKGRRRKRAGITVVQCHEFVTRVQIAVEREKRLIRSFLYASLQAS